MNVLIVDDEKIIIDSLHMILAESTLFKNIVQASDGSDACKKIDKLDFDLVVVDINMPKVDGLSVIKYIREKSGNNPEILLISGGFNHQNVQVASDFKIKHVLAKPFNAKKFVSKLTDIIQEIKNKNIAA
ncbi:response regulator [Bacteriovorax sp. Seq25_V]|uniref:response regulator n=1 Tax=Bacteriovorax sp. Seq25_V TaxID=1201288 RepID=UPI00038A08AD|nr:response regulator [Bacteriovorax sp. Seq25_V]EQC44397.1 response regulator receiver domain protein [Bacteriovorax sp. Seq25_V]